MDSDARTLRVTCGECQKKLKVSQRYAGKQVKCPGCGHPLRIAAVQEPKTTRFVPSSAVSRRTATPPADMPELDYPDFQVPVPKASSVEDRLEVVLNGLSGNFARPRLSVMYGITALFVSLVMVVLPLIYLSLIAVVGYGTYWHATHNWYWMTVVRGRAAVIVAIVYLGLTIGGALWVLSMLKPFFRNWGASEKETGISRDSEPLLYLFADRLADVVGSPRPDVISISPSVNASASFQTSFLGLFRRQFCLTIGAPLIAGLTLTQLAGVIAHEFGHFAQARGTFLNRMIYRINSWFAQAIHERDAIDELIDSLTESGNAVLAVFGFLIWMTVNIGRGILFCLMLVGMTVSRTLSRQMEYDADQYECGISGSEVFAQTSLRMTELMVADALAQHYVFTSHSANYLPKDYPAFVAGLADKSTKVKKKAKKLIRDEKSNLLSTHPLTRDRISAAERLRQPGVFKSSLPARKLMQKFKRVSETLTLLMYVLKFRDNFDETTLRSTSEAVETYMDVLGGRPAEE